MTKAHSGDLALDNYIIGDMVVLEKGSQDRCLPDSKTKSTLSNHLSSAFFCILLV